MLCSDEKVETSKSDKTRWTMAGSTLPSERKVLSPKNLKISHGLLNDQIDQQPSTFLHATYWKTTEAGPLVTPGLNVVPMNCLGVFCRTEKVTEFIN